MKLSDRAVVSFGTLVETMLVASLCIGFFGQRVLGVYAHSAFGIQVAWLFGSVLGIPASMYFIKTYPRFWILFSVAEGVIFVASSSSRALPWLVATSLVILLADVLIQYRRFPSATQAFDLRRLAILLLLAGLFESMRHPGF